MSKNIYAGLSPEEAKALARKRARARYRLDDENNTSKNVSTNVPIAPKQVVQQKPVTIPTVAPQPLLSQQAIPVANNQIAVPQPVVNNNVALEPFTPLKYDLPNIAETIPVQNYNNAIQNKNLLETQYGNLDRVPESLLTQDQKLSSRLAQQLESGLPLTGGVETRAMQNQFSKKTPIRDFGVNVGRFFLPKFLENKMFGTIEDRELLKANPVIFSPEELVNQLKNGQISLDEYKRMNDVANAYYDAQIRKIKFDRNARIAAELGITAATMGVGSIAGLGARVAPRVAQGVYKALNAANLGKKAKGVVGLSGLGKTQNVAKGLSKKAGIVAKHLVDDVTVGAATGAGINLAESAMGVDNEEGLLGATLNGGLAGGVGGGVLRSAGRAGKIASRTKPAKATKEALSEVSENITQGLENKGLVGLADSLRTAPAKWNRFWNAERKLRFKNKRAENLYKHDENINRIVNQKNTAEYRDIEHEAKVIDNSFTKDEQKYALELANKRRDTSGNLVDEPVVEKPQEAQPITKEDKPLVTEEQTKQAIQNKLNEQANKPNERIDFSGRVKEREQRTALAKQKAINFRERVKQREARTNDNVIEFQKTINPEPLESDLSHVKQEIGANTPKQLKTPLKTQSDMSGEDILGHKKQDFNNESKFNLKTPAQKEASFKPTKVTSLESPKEDVTISTDKPRTKGKEDIYENQVKAENEETLSYEGKKDALKDVVFYDNTGKRVNAIEPKSGQIKNEYSVVRRNSDGSYIVRRNSMHEMMARESNRKLNANRYKKELEEKDYNEYINRKEIEKATTETKYDEYGDDVSEIETDTRFEPAKYNNEETAKFIEDCKNGNSKEVIARKIQELNFDKNAIADFREKLMAESDKHYNKNYKVGEVDKKLADEAEADYILDLVNEFAVATKKIKKTPTQTYTYSENVEATNRLARLTKEKETIKATKHSLVHDEKVMKEERYIQSLQAEKEKLIAEGNAENSAKVKFINKKISETIKAKNSAVRDYNDKLYSQPKNQIAKRFKESQNAQAEYDSYVESLSDINYLSYRNNVNIASAALQKLNEAAVRSGVKIKTVSSIQQAVNKKGDTVMKALKEANDEAFETGNLYNAREIINNNKDLIDYNLGSDYEVKQGGFDMSEVERHYDLSFKTATDQLEALANPSRRRRALKQIYKDNLKAREDLLIFEKNKADKEGNIAKYKKFGSELADIKRFDSDSYLDKMSNSDLEFLARARARKIYSDNRRIIRRHLVDYDHPSKAMYDKDWADVNRSGKGEINKPTYRHYYETDVSYHDPEGKFVELDNKMRRFLDADHWNNDSNPWRYESSKTVSTDEIKIKNDVSKTDVIKARYARDDHYKKNRLGIAHVRKELGTDSLYRKDNEGNWINDEAQKLRQYYDKKIKPAEERIETMREIVNTSKDRSCIDKAKDELKRLTREIDSFEAYKKHIALEAKYNEVKTGYKKASSDKSKLADFATKTRLGVFRKADNPFLKDEADYRDTATGVLDKEAIYKDLTLMRDEKFLKAKAREEVVNKERAKWLKEDEKELERLSGRLNNLKQQKRLHKKKSAYPPVHILEAEKETLARYNALKKHIEAEEEALSVETVEKAYKAKLKEREAFYGDIADNFDYKKLNTFKGFKTGTRAQELRASKEKSDVELADMFDENPDVTVEFTKDPDRTHGDYAEVVFDKDGKHTILIHEVPKGMTETDLIKEEWGHVRQYDKGIETGDFSKLSEGFKRSDETHKTYNLNKSVFKQIDSLKKSGVSSDDITNALTDTQKTSIHKLAGAKYEQSKTKSEKEVHDGTRTSDDGPRVLGRSTSSNATTNEKHKTAKSYSRGDNDSIRGENQDAERNGRGLSSGSDEKSGERGITAEDLHGKSLNKSKDYSELIKELVKQGEAKYTKGGIKARKKATDTLTERLTMSSKLLDNTASDFGISNDQQINRILMTDGFNYNVRLSKGGDKMAWGKTNSEQAGVMGEKSQGEQPLTAAEQYFANKVELQKRTNILTATQHVEDNFAQPYNGEKLSGYTPVNKKLLNITLYNRYGKDFYNGITGGEEAISKMFKHDEKARKAWLSVYKEINSAKPDFQIPTHIFNKMMLNTGENAETVLKRYGKFKGSLKYAQATYDMLHANFAKGVLGLNPKWFFGNAINDATKILHKEKSPIEFIKHFRQALKLDEKHLPNMISEDNLFEVEKAATAYQRFTGNNNLDCTLNLLSGRFISDAECKTMLGKIGTGVANVLASPLVVVNKIADAIMTANSAVQKHYRKMIWVKYLDDTQNTRCKNIIQNVYKQNAYFNMLSKKVASNPKLREAAIQEMFSTLGDYVTASPFEQAVVKRIAPFYKWYRHIFKFYADEARRNPTKLALHALYMNKLMDDDVDTKEYQRGGLQITDDLNLNPTRYIDLFDTAKGLKDNPLGVLSPIIGSGIESVSGKDTFTDKALKSPNYETDYQGKVIDLRTGKHVRDSKGRKVDRLPLNESWKALPTTMARMVLLSDAPFSAEKNLLGLTTKGKSFDKMYDTSMGGYNNGDAYILNGKVKSRYATEYSGAEKEARAFIPIERRQKLSKKDLDAHPYEILANNSRLFGVIPTPTSIKYRKQADLKRKQDIYNAKRKKRD